MSLKRKSLLLFSSKLLNAFFSIVLIAILSRYLTKNYYGQYKQFTMITVLITSIFSMGLPGAALYFISKRNRKLFSINIFTITIAIALFLLLCGKPICLALDILYKTIFFSEHWLLLSLSFTLSIISMPVINILIATERIKLIPIITIVPNIIMLLSIVAIILFELPLIAILMLFVGKQLIIVLISVAIFSHDLNLKAISGKKIKEIIIFAIPLGLSGIIGIVNTNIDKLLIRYFYQEETFAVFSNGAYELPFLGLIAGSLYSVMIPNLKKYYKAGKIKELTALWLKSGKVLITIMVPIGVSFILFARPFVIFLFSESYTDSTTIFMIYQIRILFRIYIYGSLFTACGKNLIYSLNVLINFLINFILDIVLIKLIGPPGAAIATVIALLFLIVLQNYQLSKLLKSPLSSYYPLKEWLLSIIISTAVTFVIWLPYNYLRNEILGLFLLVFSCTINIVLLNLLVSNELWTQSRRLLSGMLK